MPWPDVLTDFDSFSSANPQYGPMRQLVHDLYSCAASELHATQTMGGNLLLAVEEELHHNDNVLLISFQPDDRLFHFEHRSVSNRDDSKDATIEDAWNTLRLFVGYKFGIVLPKLRPNVNLPNTVR
jgi:hypothetical protein